MNDIETMSEELEDLVYSLESNVALSEAFAVFSAILPPISSTELDLFLRVSALSSPNVIPQ